MKTFGVIDYANWAPQVFADRRMDGRCEPSTKPAFTKAMQVINKDTT